MKFKTSTRAAAAVVGAICLTGPAMAGLQETFHTCVNQFANAKQTVSVMLECTAADGKLSNCKVTDIPTNASGFDKAALCVADALPIGSKTGTVKVPIRFEGNG